MPDIRFFAFALTVQVRRHIRSERGASLLEYCLLIGLIALVCVGAASFLGGSVSKRFSSAGSSLG